MLNGLPTNDILTGANLAASTGGTIMGKLTSLTVAMAQPGGSSSGAILIPASLVAQLDKGQSLKLVLVFPVH